MKLFAIIFPLFCLAILHSPQAKGETSVSAPDQRFENAPVLSKHCNPHVDVTHFVLCLPFQQVQIIFSRVYAPEFREVSFLAQSKDFYLHTGLSPPLFS